MVRPHLDTGPADVPSVLYALIRNVEPSAKGGRTARIARCVGIRPVARTLLPIGTRVQLKDGMDLLVMPKDRKGGASPAICTVGVLDNDAEQFAAWLWEHANAHDSNFMQAKWVQRMQAFVQQITDDAMHDARRRPSVMKRRKRSAAVTT